MGLILPRSHIFKRGLFVTPGVIDSDFTGIIKIQVWSFLPQEVKKGESIAQLILLPYVSVTPGNILRENQGFGSTILNVNIPIQQEKPTLTLLVNNQKVVGLLDTGADVTVFPVSSWPAAWPKDPTREVWGIGGTSPTYRSRVSLDCAKPDNPHQIIAKIQPFLIEIPFVIWGRDILQQLKMTIQSPLL